MFTRHVFPTGGCGSAAFWLPLLALFTGARQGELAALKTKNVQSHSPGLTLLHFVREPVVGKRLKTRASQRVVPVHAELVRLGFLIFVKNVARQHGDGNRGSSPRLHRQAGSRPHGRNGSDATCAPEASLTPPKCFTPSDTP